MSTTTASLFRRARVALTRVGRKGASLVETGLLVGLIALVSIGAVTIVGDKVRTVFCQAAYQLGANVTCQDFVAGGEDGEDTEAGAPDGLTARMIDAIVDFSSGDPELVFGLGGLETGRAFTWEVRSRTGMLLASGSGARAGVENLIEVTLETGASGFGEVRIFATLASGLPATHVLPFSIVAAGAPFLPTTVTVIDGEIAAGAEDDEVVFEVGGLQPGYPFDWEIRDADGNVIASGTGAPDDEDGTVVRVPVGDAPPGEATIVVTVELPDGSVLEETRTVEIILMEDFVDLVGVEPGTSHLSNEVAVAGLSASSLSTVSGGAVIYRNGVASGASTTLEDGDMVRLQLTAPAGFEVPTIAVLSVGGIERDWIVTTRPEITPLANVAFHNRSNVDPSEEILSNVVRIGGFSGSLPVSVAGDTAEFSINGGAWTTSGTIVPGDRVQLKVISSSTNLGLRTTTVSLGADTRTWLVRTVDMGPTVNPFSFKPVANVEPNSLRAASAYMQGFSGARPISVAGHDAEIRIGNSSNGAWVTSGAVRRGNLVTVRMTAAPGFLENRVATVTAADTAADFSVTTRAMRASPAALVFKASTNQDPNTPIEAIPVTLAGFDGSQTVTVSGTAGSPQLKVNDGGWTTSATVSSGDVLTLRMTSAPGFQETRTASVTVGTTTGTWALTTRTAKTAADVFQIEPVVEATPGALAASAPFTLPGLEAPVTITAPGGQPDVEYRVGAEAWASSVVYTPGAELAVRATAPADFNQVRGMYLPIAGRNPSWSIRTTKGNTLPSGLDPAPIVGGAPSVAAYSETFTIGGLDTAAPISISGAGSRIHKRNANGTWPTNGATSTTVNNGDVIRFSAVASTTASATVTATITRAPGNTYAWTVTTTNGDGAPDDFSSAFADVEDAPATTTYYSDPITVTGIAQAVRLSVTIDRSYNQVVFGRYASINGGAYQAVEPSNNRWVSPGDVVVIRVSSTTTATAFGDSVLATITMGSTSATWRITRSDGLMDVDPIALPDLEALPNASVTLPASGHVFPSGYAGQARIEPLTPNTRYFVGASGSWQAGVGAIAAGQQLRLQVTAPSSYSATQTYQWRIGNRILSTAITTPAYRLPDPFPVADITAPSSGLFDLWSPDTRQLAGGNGPFRMRISRSDGGSINYSVGGNSSNGAPVVLNNLSGSSAIRARMLAPAPGATIMVTYQVYRDTPEDGYSISHMIYGATP